VHVLVLGGTGFVGPYVVRELDRVGHEVTIFHRGTHEPPLPRTVRHVHGTFAELEAHADALRELTPDVVLDMIPYTRADVARIRLFAGHAARAVVVSSMDVYRAFGRLVGPQEGALEQMPLTEDSALREVVIDPTYDKVGVEDEAQAIEELATTVVRLPAVHGPGDEQHRLYAYLRRMDDHRPAILLEERVVGFRWTRGYVEDVARAVALATQPHAAGRTYNVAYENTLTEREWIEAIARAHGWNGEVIGVPRDALPEKLRASFDASQDFVVDSQRIRRELGYRESVDFDEALRRTIEWERANPPEDVDLDYAAEDEVLAHL
jgi:nucleoside-diphosphate-sugar epimerase